MTLFSGDFPWQAALAAVLILLILRRLAGGFLRLGVRSLLGFGFLLLWAKSGLLAGLCLGANLFNAVVLGSLGVPGLGLLLLVRWMGT